MSGKSVQLYLISGTFPQLHFIIVQKKFLLKPIFFSLAAFLMPLLSSPGKMLTDLTFNAPMTSCTLSRHHKVKSDSKNTMEMLSSHARHNFSLLCGFD